jgi:hypothetical protein
MFLEAGHNWVKNATKKNFNSDNVKMRLVTCDRVLGVNLGKNRKGRNIGRFF